MLITIARFIVRDMLLVCRIIYILNHEKSAIGTALMNNGNNAWNHQGGSKEIWFSETTADLLNENQLSSKEKGDFYGIV